MAKYKLLCPTFVNGDLHKAGEIIDFDGIPGEAMEPYGPGPHREKLDRSQQPMTDIGRQAAEVRGNLAPTAPWRVSEWLPIKKKVPR